MKSTRNFFFASWQATVAQGNAGKSIGHLGHHAKANQGAPVLAEKSDVFGVNRFKPCAHPLHMIVVGIVGALGRLVCATKTDLIRHQHAHA